MDRREEAKKWLIKQVQSNNPCKNNFVRVYTGTRLGSTWPSDTSRNTGGYIHYEEIDDQKEFKDLWGNWKKTITEFANILFDDSDEGIIRALFPEQILQKTQSLSGQNGRRPALQIIKDVLAHRLISKDVYYVFTKRTRASTGPMLLRRILNFSNMASIWSPSDIVDIYEDLGTGLNIVCLAGSWGSPIYAATKMAPDFVKKMLVYDVIDEYKDLVSWVDVPFKLELDLQGSEKEPKRRNEFDVVIWNPPYWCLEQYDSVITSTIEQGEKQSTYDKEQSFTDWLEDFIYKSAQTAYKLLKRDGKFLVVVPKEVRFTYSFRKGYFNTEGLVNEKGVYSISDFGRQVKNKILHAGFDLKSKRLLKQYTRGSSFNGEYLYWFVK